MQLFHDVLQSFTDKYAPLITKIINHYFGMRSVNGLSETEKRPNRDIKSSLISQNVKKISMKNPLMQK